MVGICNSGQPLAAQATAPQAAAPPTSTTAGARRPPLIAYRRNAAPAHANPAATAVSVAVGQDSAAAPAAVATPPRAQPAPARRLAPRSGGAASEATGPAEYLSASLPAKQLLSTAGAGLAIVVGLLLACAWLVRRSGARPQGVLPAEAFSVLGRAPLFGQTGAHLLRLGNKLVLVAASADGVHPIGEVDDPDEVERLTGLCMSGNSHSATAEFQQVMQQLAKEPARGYLGSSSKRA